MGVIDHEVIMAKYNSCSV